MANTEDGAAPFTHRRGITCQISAFEVPNPPLDPEAKGRKWLAIVTAHAYDPNVSRPPLNREQAALVGETMRSFSARAFADTQAAAMKGAVDGLLFELTAKGFSDDHDVKLW